MQEYGPQTAFGQLILKKKYALPGEDWRDIANRVAYALSDNSQFYHTLREPILRQWFVPAGRILAGAGTTKNVTLFNCFASGTISDSYVDGPGSIMDRAKEAAATMRMGGGIGYDFSTLRPRNSMIKKLQSNATGPVSFMHIFDAVGLATCSSGHRRGAQMGILRVDHPDIEEFIHAKQDQHSLTGFNISVAVTDAFMQAVERGDAEFPLTFEGQTYRTINPGALWEAIMRSAWDWAEPGVVFINRMNDYNNLIYCEQIATTNPCSEQPLPPYGACNLGSMNLPKFLLELNGHPRAFNHDALARTVTTAVRALDMVNDVSTYPLPEQKNEALSKRRVGLGVMGLANAIESLGFQYGSEEFIAAAHKIFSTLANSAYRASALLAKEKGPFPLYDRDQYHRSLYLSTLNDDVQDLIWEHGIRNSHLISMAPTGTINLVADNVSGGIEPTLELRSSITVHLPEQGETKIETQDYAYANLGIIPKISSEVTANEHIDVLCCAQKYTDSACSKTCNVTGAMPWTDFKAIFHKAWRRGAKSCSVFNKDGKRGAAVVASTEQSGCATGTCDI